MKTQAILVASLLILTGCRAHWVGSTSTGFTVEGAAAEHHLAAGIDAYARGNLERAQHQFEKALGNARTSGQAYNNLGLIYFDLGDFKAASTAFMHAVARIPDSPEPVNNLGLVKEQVGRLDEAAALYLQAHAMAPEEPQYLGNSIRVRRKLNSTIGELTPDIEHLLEIESRPAWRSWATELLDYQSLREEASIPNVPESFATDHGVL